MNRVRANYGFICAHGDVRRHTVPPERHKSGVSRISTRPFRRASPSKERPESPKKMTESKVIHLLTFFPAKTVFIFDLGDLSSHNIPPERQKSGVFIIPTQPFRRPSTAKNRPHSPRKHTESTVCPLCKSIAPSKYTHF